MWNVSISKTERGSLKCRGVTFINVYIRLRITNGTTANFVLYHLELNFKVKIIIELYWRRWELAKKRIRTTFVDVDIYHRMTPPRMLYSVKFTYISMFKDLKMSKTVTACANVYEDDIYRCWHSSSNDNITNKVYRDLYKVYRDLYFQCLQLSCQASEIRLRRQRMYPADSFRLSRTSLWSCSYPYRNGQQYRRNRDITLFFNDEDKT